MKLAFDAKRAFHNHRGLGNYSRDIIRLLNTYYPENDYYLFNPKEKGSIRLSLPQNIKVILPANFLHKKLHGYWRSRGMTKQLKQIKPDIYHGLSQELPYGIDKTGIKTVVTMHDAIFMRYPELYDKVYRKTFIKKNTYSCRVANTIIAISEQTRQDFIEYFNADPAKIKVVYQGCNNIFRQSVNDALMAEVRKKYDLPHSFILNVGAIEKRKNLETVIKALHTANIDMALVVIGGKTPYLNEVKKLIETLKLKKQVHFLHHVATDDLPAIYKMAQLFVYPSVFEGFGIPILEALCTGTPVITSKGSCFAETGGPSSIYVHYNNTEEMGEAMKKVLTDTTLREKMIHDGLQHADLFTDDKIAANLMQVYTDTILL